MTSKTLALAALATLAFVVAPNSPAQARDQIRIVGSSTVFPFTSTVVERFGQTTKFPAPILEATGTGGGFRLFCGGVGADHPDVTGASRPMKASEFETCQKNGVEQITEIKVGYDGIAFAHSKARPSFALTKEIIFRALAKEVEVDGKIVENPYQQWSDIDPSLPAADIEVFGPPPTSGTRDAFLELVMDVGCESFDSIKALEGARKAAVCRTMREDGAFIEAGENDNLIVQRLASNPEAFGIFGYSFLEENLDKVEANPIGGVKPEYDAISSGAYPVSRSLFIYVKNGHVGVIPGLKEFVGEYTSERAFGPDGYLADKGLVALPDAERSATTKAARDLVPMAKPTS